MDRRVIRTKKAIRKAFARLLTQKNINDITVTEIADLADINRKTFYNYYSGIYQIVEELENEAVKSLEEFLGSIDITSCIKDPMILFRRMEETLSADGEFYDLFFRMRDNDSLFIKFQNRIITVTTEEARKQLDIDPAMLDAITTFIFGGEIAAYRRWLDSGKSMSLEELSGTIARLCSHGLTDILGTDA